MENRRPSPRNLLSRQLHINAVFARTIRKTKISAPITTIKQQLFFALSNDVLYSKQKSTVPVKSLRKRESALRLGTSMTTPLTALNSGLTQAASFNSAIN